MRAIAIGRREPNANAGARLRAMLELDAEYRDGRLPLAQKSAQALEQGCAHAFEAGGGLDLAVERAACIKALRAAKTSPHIGAPPQRTIELIEPVRANASRQAGAWQAYEIAHRLQSHAREQRLDFVRPAQ